MRTSKIKITKQQYETGYFAIDTKTSDHWFINNDENICVWVGRNKRVLENLVDDLHLGFIEAEYSNEYIKSDCGIDVEIEAIELATSKCCNELNLKALEQGIINWC